MKIYFENWKDATACIVNWLKNNPNYFVQFEKEACECGNGSIVCIYDQKLSKKFIGIVCKTCHDKALITDRYLTS
jgi:hypothetical protein